MEDKLIVVYEGSYAQYRGDWLKDEYVNKLVIVTGKQSSISIEERKSYLCVSNGEKSVAIPLPSVYLQGVMVGGERFAYTDGYIRFAEANGVSISIDNKTGDLSIGISEKINSTISNLVANLSQVNTKADNAVSAAESAATKAEEANQTASSAIATANEASAQVTAVAKGVAQNKAKIEAIEEDYISKGEAVDFATDLTGVVEATAEEFVYRPSAGEKSIRDESAVIRRIKGNSVVWEQKLKPLTSDNWNQYSATYANIEFINNSATISLTSAYTGQDVYNIGLRYSPTEQNTTIEQKYLSGHKYLIVGLCKLQSGGKLLIEMTGQNFETDNIPASPNKWVSFGIIFSPTKDASTLYIKPPFSYSKLREGSSYSISNVMLFDLTAMFGADNVPAEDEENDYMNKFLATYNDAYYPYCAKPELRSMKTWAIKTVGFNLFNKNNAVVGVLTSTGSIDNSSSFAKRYFAARLKVLPNTKYYLLNVSNHYYYRSYVFFDAFGNAISSGGLQAGTSAYNASGTVTTPNNAAYMGVVVPKTFIDQCCINFSHSGVRDGEYEPYVLHTLELPEIVALFPNGMHAVGDVYDEINIDTYIQRCEYRDYVEGDESNAEVLTDGVHTVAKLTNPIVTPLSEPIALDYYCEDWGSEEAIPVSSASAPFRADIVYQFNAEGRIRDNSRNIDKLEKLVAPLKNIPSNTPLATQGFVLSHIPTRVATATERVKMYEGQTQLLELLPNVMYDWTGGGSLLGSITIPPLYINTETIGTYDHQWMVRVGSDTSDKVTIPFDVLWKDGIAPNWTSWGICEITFKCDAQQDEAMRKIIGEWKIYK